MRNTIGALAALAMLSGCVAEEPAKGVALNKLQASCTAYGFQAGTDAFNTCVFQLDQQRIANARNDRIAFGESLQRAGAGIQANAARQSNCTYRRFGNTVQQNCY